MTKDLLSYANSAKKNIAHNPVITAKHKYFTVAMRNIKKDNPDMSYDDRADAARKKSSKVDWTKRENLAKWFNYDLYA